MLDGIAVSAQIIFVSLRCQFHGVGNVLGKADGNIIPLDLHYFRRIGLIEPFQLDHILPHVSDDTDDFLCLQVTAQPPAWPV